MSSSTASSLPPRVATLLRMGVPLDAVLAVATLLCTKDQLEEVKSAHAAQSTRLSEVSAEVDRAAAASRRAAAEKDRGDVIAGREVEVTTTDVRLVNPVAPSSSLTVPLQHVKRPADVSTVSKDCDLWAFVWSSGSLLAEVVLGMTASDGIGAGATVMELGAGAGLPSIVAAQCAGPEVSVTATDLVQDALTLLSRNCDGAVKTVRLNWEVLPSSDSRSRDSGGGGGGGDDGDGSRAILLPRQGFDFVLGADVLYLSSSVVPVVRACAHFLRRGGVVVLVDPGRPTADGKALGAAAEDVGLTVARHAVFFRLPTGVAAMKKCAVFVLCHKDDDRGAVPLAPRLASLDRCFDGLRARQLPAAGTGTKTEPKDEEFRYTLK